MNNIGSSKSATLSLEEQITKLQQLDPVEKTQSGVVTVLFNSRKIIEQSEAELKQTEAAQNEKQESLEAVKLRLFGDPGSAVYLKERLLGQSGAEVGLLEQEKQVNKAHAMIADANRVINQRVNPVLSKVKGLS